ncbi:MAG: long-chain fatty acid--CoA ligase [Kofleriaceae bacterium]|nr:long-chain fatty acid--CoA ligase [Myxococcales bacterium]MCB9559820.1 long-chain fatty acid--CoA ligase [Kofleriaceae bacterium]MCB9571431.1 long-chain fatty acid--CoA ligase [Kofleriaceae bacterium]
MPADTIISRALSHARTRPYRPAYYQKQGGHWRPTTWKQFAAEIRAVARGLIALGFPPGGKVCMLGFNRPEWVIFNHAAMAAGGAGAGIYTTCSPEEVQYIVHHAEAFAVLVEDEGQWRKIQALRAEMPLLRHVVTMRGVAAIDDPLVLSWDDLMARGADVAEAVLDERLEAIEPDALATMIYTSGTTGPPKGVMLSHRNLAWTARTMVDLGSGRDSDSTLSYLPLSHIAEQMATIHMPATTGASVYFAESIDKVPDNLKEVQPTIFFGVPRIWEKFHAGVSAKLRQATGARKALVDWTRKVCTEVNALRCRGQAPGPMLELQYKLADRLVLSKLKPALGLGRARNCISGAAPIAQDVIEFFASLDILVQEIYGQSEDNGPTTFNMPGRTKFGTVGVPLPGVQVKIAEDGEIIVKGPNVFLGYYKEPEATAETLIDGWLHSGDLGEFDADGFLTITGRKKDIIITAGGKNVAPKNIEAAIKESPLVSEAVVIGDRRKYLVALITLDDEAAAAWLATHGGGNGAAAHDRPEIAAELQRVIDGVNAKLARVEQIKKFKVLPRPFGIDTGELTPTLKVKRKVVNQNFAAEIESMYADA